jgi:hypothetical protein
MAWWAWTLLVLWGPSTALALLLCGGYAVVQLFWAIHQPGESALAEAATSD